MKILAHGKKFTKTWSKKFTCTECKSRLEVEASDLYVYNTAVFYAGETWEPEIFFNCPVCQSSNKVTDMVPSGITGNMFSQAAAKRSANDQ